MAIRRNPAFRPGRSPSRPRQPFRDSRPPHTLANGKSMTSMTASSSDGSKVSVNGWSCHSTSRLISSICNVPLTAGYAISWWPSESIWLLQERRRLPITLKLKPSAPDVMYSVICTPDYARALCLWFNSVFGISQFLTERMETRGSFCDLLLETLNLLVVPSMAFATRHLADLDSLMTRYGNEQLPSLIEQFTTPPAARLALDSTMMTIMGWTRREAESMLPQVYKALASELTLVASAMSGQIADEEPDSAHTQLGLDESDAD